PRAGGGGGARAAGRHRHQATLPRVRAAPFHTEGRSTMTADPELDSKLRALAAAVAPPDGFADRVAAQIERLPRPAVHRRRVLGPVLLAAAVLAAISIAIYLAHRSTPPSGPAPENESAVAPKEKPHEGGTRNPPSVAYSLSAIAYVNSKWGFIDRTGKAVIPARYTRVDEFSEGLAPVKVDGYHAAGGQWGYVDRSGAEVIRPQFDWARAFREGLAGVKVGQKWGFIDRTGKLVIAARFEAAERCSEGLAAVQEDGAWGFIGPDGMYRIPPRFGYALGFSEGLAAVRDRAIPGVNPKSGYVDRSGAYAIELDPQFTYAGAFHEGRAAIERDGLWGFI